MTSFIGGAIDIKDRYGLRYSLGVDFLGVDKVLIHGAAGSSIVQEHLDGIEFTGVSHADFYREDQEHSICIKSISRELFGQLFLPFWFSEEYVDDGSRGRGGCVFRSTVTCIYTFYVKYSKLIYREQLGCIFHWSL